MAQLRTGIPSCGVFFYGILFYGIIGFTASLHPAVVINEIFYHAPNNVDDLQYVELHNSSDQPEDLSGWKFTQGIHYEFPPGSRIEAHGYWVLCRNLDRFKEFYGFSAQGSFERSLGRTGEEIELVNAKREKADGVHYRDDPPWPAGPDGHSSSLERICPTAESSLPQNWAASPPSEDGIKPAGTPGKQNASFSASLPPIISDVIFTPADPAPDEPVSVEADVRDPDGVREVRLLYRVARSGSESEESSAAMTKVSEHRFKGTLPGQKKGCLLRCRVQARDEKGAERVHPGPNEPRPALSSFVHEKLEPGKIPFGLVINVGEAEFKAAERREKPNRGRFDEEGRTRWMARMMLESGMDLPSAWFELTMPEDFGFDSVQKLRPLFAAKLSEREKLIEKALQASSPQSTLSEIPALVKTFQAGLFEALKPLLGEEEKKKLSKWQEEQSALGARGPAQWGPEVFLKRMVNLEGAYFQLSKREDFSAAQLLQIKKHFRPALEERAELFKKAKTIMEERGDWEDLQQKIEDLNEGLEKSLKPILTAEQERDLGRWRDESSSFSPGQGGVKAPRSQKGACAFVFIDPETKKVALFDFVSVTERSGGYKVRFQKGEALKGMSTINLIFEYNDRFVLAEPLAYEVYRRAGNAAELTDFVRLWIDGKLLGYYLLVEQPNRAFLRRNKLSDDGNLYKILWYNRGVVGQHEKKTNFASGHEDLLQLIESLEKVKGADQWEVIKKHFNVEQVINYFAVNTCLSHWDGFFNNYFTYHDPEKKKWEMYPWDQDKTWGFYDGIRRGEVFHDMPLTFGMEGDVPPGWPKDRPPPRGFGGRSSWWRPGGYFSKPLLANPEFRKHYLARTKEILETVYTEETFFPVIDRMGERLKEEVRVRAEVTQEDPDRASERLQENLQSLKDHLVKRRKFLLEQDELRLAGKFDPSALK